MRGDDRHQEMMFSYVSPEMRVPQDHPLRTIRRLVDTVLADLSPQFDRLYSDVGRPSIPPEQLLRALLLQVLYTIRSERQLMEQLDYNLLYRWFVGLQMDDRVWDPTVFTKNRERLLAGEIDGQFFERVLDLARQQKLLSDEHFTVDGTLVEAWAGQKSFRPRKGGRQTPPDDPGNATVDFRGQSRSNETHVSTTDPEARLYRKSFGTESKLCYAGHLLMDNRHGLVVDARLSLATGKSEREVALAMAADIPGDRHVTLGADKAYDVRSLVQEIRKLNVTPHVAARQEGYSAVDGRTTRHVTYLISQRRRKRIEEVFGWLKTIGLMRKTRHRGVARVGWMFRFTTAVYNLVRMKNLELQSG